MSLLSAIPTVEDTPLDRYLSRQADLTAVERFAQHHEHDLEPGQARYYRDLIPMTAPAPGQQYAFAVDLDECTGCKACVAACHSLNGLDEGESWRTVSMLRGGGPEQPWQQTVTSACHHCAEPACLKGCPVDAYVKDPVTGIVFHLDDQCIGCAYCTLTCPYEVPTYNGRLGIVRKCDLCRGRLAVGEAPACVQACPNQAISVTLVTADPQADAGRIVPGAPPSSITRPTTVYRSRTGRAEAEATVAGGAGPAHAHPPLAVMLVLTQLSVGAFVVDLALRASAGSSGAVPTALDAAVAVASGVLALAASMLHLGRPRYGYRALLGIGHSWLSREVAAFGGFTGLAVLYALAVWWGDPLHGAWLAALGWLAGAFGVAGVGCSVLIYATTRRASWSTGVVTARFAATAATCGSAAVAWSALVSGRTATAGRLMVALAALSLLKLGAEHSVLWRRRGQGVGGDGAGAGARTGPERDRRARLLQRELRPVRRRREMAGLLGGAVLPLATAWGVPMAHGPAALGILLATAALGGTVAGELLERTLFFTASGPPR